MADTEANKSEDENRSSLVQFILLSLLLVAVIFSCLTIIIQVSQCQVRHHREELRQLKQTKTQDLPTPPPPPAPEAMNPLQTSDDDFEVFYSDPAPPKTDGFVPTTVFPTRWQHISDMMDKMFQLGNKILEGEKVQNADMKLHSELLSKVNDMVEEVVEYRDQNHPPGVVMI